MERQEVMLRQDGGKKGRMGVTLMIPADKRTQKVTVGEDAIALNIDENSQFILKPNMRYNILDPYEKFWLDIAKKVNVIGNKNQMGEAFYYLEDIEKDAKQEVSTKEEMLDVILQIKQLSHEEKIELSKILGVDGSVMTLPVLTRYLYDIAETTSNKSRINYITLRDLLNNRDEYEYKLLIAELKFKDYIVYEKNQWVYNETFLGYDEKGVMDFLKNPLNETLVNQFKHLVFNKEVEKKGKKIK